jgi:hypothetical protein
MRGKHNRLISALLFLATMVGGLGRMVYTTVKQKQLNRADYRHQGERHQEGSELAVGGS